MSGLQAPDLTDTLPVDIMEVAVPPEKPALLSPLATVEEKRASFQSKGRKPAPEESGEDSTKQFGTGNEEVNQSSLEKIKKPAAIDVYTPSDADQADRFLINQCDLFLMSQIMIAACSYILVCVRNVGLC